MCVQFVPTWNRRPIVQNLYYRYSYRFYSIAGHHWGAVSQTDAPWMRFDRRVGALRLCINKWRVLLLRSCEHSNGWRIGESVCVHESLLCGPRPPYLPCTQLVGARGYAVRPKRKLAMEHTRALGVRRAVVCGNSTAVKNSTLEWARRTSVGTGLRLEVRPKVRPGLQVLETMTRSSTQSWFLVCLG